MEFEKFSKDLRKLSRGFFVSVSKQLNLTLSNEFYEKLDNAEFVELFYARTKKSIGLKVLGEKTDDSYHIRVQTFKGERSPMHIISAGAFFRHYGIIPTKTRRFAPSWDENEKLWVIKLDEPIPESEIKN